MLLAWLVSHQWQGFSRSDQALSDFEIFRAALLAMEKVSAERGPMNAALGEDVPVPAQRIAALRKAREESDASLRDLAAAIEASHCEECAALYGTATHAITTLAEARKHADDVLLVPHQTRSPELLDNAVNHMANVIPIIAGIADGTIGDIVSGDAAVWTSCRWPGSRPRCANTPGCSVRALRARSHRTGN